MAKLRINSPGWAAQPGPTRASRGATRGAGGAAEDFPAEFLTDDSEVAAELTSVPKPATRGGPAAVPDVLDASYQLAPGETAVLAMRHPSRALTFHRPVEATRPSRGNGPAEVRFIVPVSSTGRTATTRGGASSVVKAFIVKVAKKAGDKIASLVLSKLVAELEAAIWRRKGLEEGWLGVTPETLQGKLTARVPSSSERSLLFIHGTFSNAAAAYGPLAKSDFFERVKGLYGDRIFAYDHFTLSRTPEENVRDLLDRLPDETFTFDVITHSRGGLVLRNLVERSKQFGALANRFKLGRAILVASPNEGTPLATPKRWEDTVGWMANLLELIPDNPFTTGAEFVANGIVWIARHASGDLPGLRSMDGDGDMIAELQGPPGPPADAYSALVANYSPSQKVLQRMIDAGVDQFFGSANDLVVPSEGGWRIDRSGTGFIPATRIGCFGPGGNLPGDAVTHTSFFAESATVNFLTNALAGKNQALPLVDPAKNLPDRRLVRSGAPGVSAPSITGRRAPAGRRDRWRGTKAKPAVAAPQSSVDSVQTLSLSIVNGDLTFEREPLLLGHYQATKLTGAERVIDRLVGRAMSRALQLGDYPTGAGTHRVFVNHHLSGNQLMPRPEAVIVVGLGQEGSLQGAELSRSVRQGVLAWARHLVEESQNDSAPPHALRPTFCVASTLIGSGGTGIATGQAAQLIAQGVHDANEQLKSMAPVGDARQPWPIASSVRIVELYLDRASEAWHALQMLAEATPERYRLEPVIVAGTGPLRRPLDGGYRGAEYDFITAETRIGTDGAVEIAYALDTNRARTEIRALAPQGQLVRNLVKTASSDQNDDPRIGRTLFKLLIPIDLESFLSSTTDMQIELDAGTAGIPWELLDDRDDNSKDDREPWAIRSKLLRKLRTGTFRPQVKDADGDAYALVIGEPECPEEYGRLLGAREEALAVYASLEETFAARLTRLISDDETVPGSDARTVINTLFERDWRVIHIAGHGALPEKKSQGGVVLSDGTFVGPSEIKAMRVVPELVFINCCHLGAASNASVLAQAKNPSLYDRALFASSVARELIDIGVRCVIAAGWAVDDEAAKNFAQTFYSDLAKGHRFIDAVAHARMKAYETYGNTWAAYQCYGDPDWRLIRNGVEEQGRTVEQELEGITSVTMLKLALETLWVQKSYQGYSTPYLRERVWCLENKWRTAKWVASDGVAESFARVHAALGDKEQAIAWYDTAIGAPDGNVSFTAIEQAANLRIRQAADAVDAARRKEGTKKGRKRTGKAKTAPASVESTVTWARAIIAKNVEILKELMGGDHAGSKSGQTTFHPTAERASLCGSAMKRLAMIEAIANRPEKEAQAIEAMKDYYRLAQRISAREQLDNLFYPASNYIAAELALHAGEPGWRFPDPSVFKATRDSLRAKAERDPDFWSAAGEIEIEFYEAVAVGQLAQQYRHLEKRYRDLDQRMRDHTKWDSVHGTAKFVLDKYQARGSVAAGEKKAAADVLALLQSFLPPAATVGSNKRAR